jgi:TonB family protein
MNQQTMTKIVRQSSFWLSLLIHLIILFSFILVIGPATVDERRPELYIPSYISNPLQEPVVQPSPVQPTPPAPQQPVTQKKQPVSKNGIEKPVTQPAAATPTAKRAAKQVESMNPSLEKQGIHLIGDEKIDKSLRTILGKAIGQHLFYPRSAYEYGIKGTVLVGFTLHPDGQVTGIQLVKSSNAGILNSAALSAINEISPVEGVEEFVVSPRYLIVGIILN